MSSLFVDTHNVVVILEKSDAAEGFEQIIDFLSGSYIHYALTVSPHICISCIKQFWNSVSVKRSGDVTRLQALVDKKKIVIFEAVLHEILQLNDTEGVTHDVLYLSDIISIPLCEAKTKKSLANEPPMIELKALPPHLEYAFLEGNDKLPIIIEKDLSVEEKAAL
nr:reverse transcriptase domain-containing protein [Tanacetum cinerariifolium]